MSEAPEMNAMDCQEKINWSICCLCRDDDDDCQFTCPSKTKRGDVGSGYTTMDVNLRRLSEIDAVPFKLDINSLDDGHGIKETLLEHEAKWHKKCGLMVNNLKVEREYLKRKRDEPEVTGNKVFTRMDGSGDGPNRDAHRDTCYFCSEGNESGDLHSFSCLPTDYAIRRYAILLEDKQLIAKLSTGDLIAQEAKYHRICLTRLYNKGRCALQKRNNANSDQHVKEGLALAELISYITESYTNEKKHIFRLADLGDLYKKRLQQMGISVEHRIHTTHLKERLLLHMPQMKDYNKGRDVFLTSNKHVSDLLYQGYQMDQDEFAVVMQKISAKIREEMFALETSFIGSLEQKTEGSSKTLASLLTMIVNGSNIVDQSAVDELSQPVASVAQIITYNTIKCRRRTSAITHQYHSQDREPPLPLYLGLKLYSATRQRKLIDACFAIGISCSYDRVMNIVSHLGDRICRYYEEKRVVCPPQLKRGIFVSAAIDNVDHNTSSSSSNSGSFHGTSISIFQNIYKETVEDNNEDMPLQTDFRKTNKKIRDLPLYYTKIVHQETRTSSLQLPDMQPCIATKMCGSSDDITTLHPEFQWLQHVNIHCHDPVTQDSKLSWAAYHASKVQETPTPSINTMLPLFSNEVCSSTMVHHCLKVVRAAVDHINPSQPIIICADQPVYAKGKQDQWSSESEFTEENSIMLLGGLHTEMTIYKVLGHWLEGSGWVEALHQANIATLGVAESFLKATHVTRTRHAHHVTACVLYAMLKDAYEKDQNENIGHNCINFLDWCHQRKEESPQFLYWWTCLEIELNSFEFVRSLRTGDFDMYTNSLGKIVPWFFVTNRTHYSRWMPVHIRDMHSLDHTHPLVAQEFRKGAFVMAKSCRKFSLMSLDQGHEQNNCKIKNEGGIIGITQDPEALLRWAVSGPELVRVISEFEATIIGKEARDIPGTHHEETKSVQDTFISDVNSLTKVFNELGNPFTDTSGELIHLSSKDVMGKAVVENLHGLVQKGKEQYADFVEKRLKTKKIPVSDRIPRNEVLLFHQRPKRKEHKKDENIHLLKSEASLFSRLYIASQQRKGDIDTFFSHENQSYPPSLSIKSELRFGTKSDLLGILESKQRDAEPSTPRFSATIIDGGVLLHLLEPHGCDTFGEYATKTVIPYIQSIGTARIDLVWDQYNKKSLKGQLREKRLARGALQKIVESSTTVPKPSKWHDFLTVTENKVGLCEFLTEKIKESTIWPTNDKQLVVTNGQSVICIPEMETTQLAPCNHEEADTRLMVHIKDAMNKGHRQILVRTNDTDVLVLAVAIVQELGDSELWILFGKGANLRYIACHEIAQSIGPQKARALPLFHAFSGCDCVSAFLNIGKTTHWRVWSECDEVMEAFLELLNAPEEIEEETFTLIERYTILLYARRSELTSINALRKYLFTEKHREMINLPPTQGVLREHLKRAVLQGGHYWGNVTTAYRQHPSPDLWGWNLTDEKWQPLWTKLPQASAACSELTRCNCRSKCTSCKCVKASLKCTSLCGCKALCQNKSCEHGALQLGEK